MKINYIKKIIIFIIGASLIFSLFIPSVISNDIKKDKKTISVRVWDTISGKISNHCISYEEFQDIIEKMNYGIKKGSFLQEIIEKINLLKNYEILSEKTANKILYQNQIYQNKIHKLKSNILDNGVTALNIFSGTFFGMKGEKDSSFLELEVFRLPFFDGNITGGFTGFAKFTGNGSVFTIGFLGFKYIYDFNNEKYGFPYFPVITGSIFGFSGIFIEVYAQGENIPDHIEGNYLFGAGTSIITNWKIQ